MIDSQVPVANLKLRVSSTPEMADINLRMLLDGELVGDLKSEFVAIAQDRPIHVFSRDPSTTIAGVRSKYGDPPGTDSVKGGVASYGLLTLLVTKDGRIAAVVFPSF